MDNDKMISVVVPVYNVEKYIEKSITSITAQTYKNLQIILVDDGSTDGSGVLCEQLAETDPRIEVIHQKNAGVSSARNVGMSKAKGEYIAFVDPDDSIAPEMYEVLYSNMKAYSAQCSVGGVRRVYESSNAPKEAEAERSVKVMRGEEALDFAADPDNPWVGYPVNKLFSRRIIEDNRLSFNENIIMNEDSIFCYQYMLRCDKVVRDTQPLYNYLIRSTSITRAIMDDLTKLDRLPEAAEILYDMARPYKGKIFYKRMAWYYGDAYMLYLYRLFKNGAFDSNKVDKTVKKIDGLKREAGYLPLEGKKKFFYYCVKYFPRPVYWAVKSR